MNRGSSRSRGWKIGLATVVAVAIVGMIYWIVFHDRPRVGAEVVSEPVAASFYKGLAALDVEENERAARVFEEAVAEEPREPALWANLAVAQLRLGEPNRAGESLQRALQSAPEARELALLKAEVLKQAGEIEQAIAQLRDVHRLWPENIAATASLASLLGQIRSDEAEAERLALLSDILERDPGNLQALTEKARIAASLERRDELQTAIDALQKQEHDWPEAIAQQLQQAAEAAEAGDFRQASLSLTFFENLLKPRPEYQQSLAELGISGVGSVGTPVRSLLRFQLPAVEAAQADLQMTFEPTPFSETAVRPDLVLAVASPGARRSTLLLLSDDALRIGESAALPFPGSSSDATAASLAVADLNADFQQDLVAVGNEGAHIFLQDPEGEWSELSAEAEVFERPWQSVWAVDVEADGDLDLLLSDVEGSFVWARNDGDATFTEMPTEFPDQEVAALQQIDIDRDGDIDLATLDTAGSLRVLRNDRGGSYAAESFAPSERRLGLAVGDVDRDGRFDVVSLDASGQLFAASWQASDGWSEKPLVKFSESGSLSNAAAGDVLLAVEDLDNNGGVDLVVSSGEKTAIWLQADDASWTPLAPFPAMHVTSIIDWNGDGLLDLVGSSQNDPLVALNRSQAGYGWLAMEPRANTSAGDKRINPFGIGGRIEARAGTLVQAAPIDAPRVHFGLGRHRQADVARIVWPNGTVQAEFDLASGQSVVAHQRLKGSCPWVFAYDGEAFRFVKDFIWRSPLGLRINAQSTAGVTQTEDWIKIAGDQLAAADGRYPLRITAELWETHFFDHVALLAVDHPADVAVFVDERFVPQATPAREVVAATPPKPLRDLANHRGESLDEALRHTDGVYADRFALGEYQGVAEEHWVEFDVPPEVEASADRPVILVGHGWIYPTDSSLNVALSQGETAPFGLVLEQRDADGQWKTVHDGLGFPAGKNKDVLIALPADALAHSRRFRLRTNMEVYWDSLGWSYRLSDVEPHMVELDTDIARLRRRGFSRLLISDRRRPETPQYELAATGQPWLDLEGFYTRPGDVSELLASTDDRYVIMNAGDELVLEFAAEQDTPDGWKRDFILVGDGWVKDGDYNTAFSRWVRPLPSHNDHDYSGPLVPLQDDPVYRRHHQDWLHYHTRYVTPRSYQQGLWQPELPRSSEEMQ